jgi:hypothetical protein
MSPAPHRDPPVAVAMTRAAGETIEPAKMAFYQYLIKHTPKKYDGLKKLGRR